MKVICELAGYPTKYGGVREFIARDKDGCVYYCASGVDDDNNLVCERVRLVKHKTAGCYVPEDERDVDIGDCSLMISADLIEEESR